MLCINGCEAERYKLRLVCQKCVAAEMRARRRRDKNVEPDAIVRRGRPPEPDDFDPPVRKLIESPPFKPGELNALMAMNAMRPLMKPAGAGNGKQT